MKTQGILEPGSKVSLFNQFGQIATAEIIQYEGLGFYVIKYLKRGRGTAIVNKVKFI